MEQMMLMNIESSYEKEDIRLIISHKWSARKENRQMLFRVRGFMAMCLLVFLLCLLEFCRLGHAGGIFLAAFLSIITLIMIIKVITVFSYMTCIRQKMGRFPRYVNLIILTDRIVLQNMATRKTIIIPGEYICMTESEDVIDFNGILWIVKKRVNPQVLSELRETVERLRKEGRVEEWRQP